MREAGDARAAISRANLLRQRAASLELSTSKELVSVHKAGIESLCLDQIEQRYLLAGAADGSIAAYDCELAMADAEQDAREREEQGEGGSRQPVRHLPGRSLQQHRALFHVRKGGAVGQPDGHAFGVTSVQWYPVDTGLFVSSSFDGTVKVWDSNTLQLENSFTLPEGPVHCAAMSPLGTGHTLIAIAASSSNIRLGDLASEGFTHMLTGHRGPVWAVRWSLSSEWCLFSGGSDGAVRAWDVRRAGTLMVFDQHNAHDPRVDLVRAATAHQFSASTSSIKAPRLGGVLTPQGYRRGYGGGAGGAGCRAPSEVRARKSPQSSLRGGGEVRVTAHAGEVTSLLPLPGGNQLLSAGRDGRVRLWDLHTGKNSLVNYGGTRSTGQKGSTMACSQDGRHFYYPSGSVLKVYETQSGGQVSTLKGHFASISCCVSNPNTQEVYSGSSDRQILVWDPPGAGSYGEYPCQRQNETRDGGNAVANLDVDTWSDDES